jgi:hypothetical protein
VKNIRRQSKKKVTKFKTREEEWYDSYWTGTLISPLPQISDIVYKSSGIQPHGYDLWQRSFL